MSFNTGMKLLVAMIVYVALLDSAWAFAPVGQLPLRTSQRQHMSSMVRQQPRHSANAFALKMQEGPADPRRQALIVFGVIGGSLLFLEKVAAPLMLGKLQAEKAEKTAKEAKEAK
mmetsp:Transcript_59038/g.120968  ORF Transcript_59038/g.120968 Transcript_59038/m.120968 type:complete len:115 (-) Transcript_59038:5-349(-)|eukprot:CAMPEP_0181298400 /NCGR_PEP_ID=MMETSP1101-20121128/5759_1 /TAXON_ID=46948 /ORGANISM="Rhodomonas abbreviata, Strain Caron Lab Isolate" /LENGTH=114 /DNA_ID=CAMNT_0023403413 /DNA_START=16 /DNA_END=357 /DNA_ORIENTATION=+